MSWVLTGQANGVAASSVSVDNCFSADYDHYMIACHMFANGAGGASELRARLRAGGSDATASEYYRQRVIARGSTFTGVDRSSAGTVWGSLPFGGSVNGDGVIMMISLPFLARPTTMHGWTTLSAGSSGDIWWMGHTHSASTSYDGITFLTDAGTMTFNAYIYGLKETA